LNRLREILQRRGITTTSAVLLALLGAEAAAAAPAGTFAALKLGAQAGAGATLARAALNSLYWTKVRVGTIIVAAFAAIGIAGVFWRHVSNGGDYDVGAKAPALSVADDRPDLRRRPPPRVNEVVFRQERSIFALAMSPDGGKLVTGSDQVVRVWD